eukprot:3159085-Rhodomonas_salina.1
MSSPAPASPPPAATAPPHSSPTPPGWASKHPEANHTAAPLARGAARLAVFDFGAGMEAHRGRALP